MISGVRDNHQWPFSVSLSNLFPMHIVTLQNWIPCHLIKLENKYMKPTVYYIAWIMFHEYPIVLYLGVFLWLMLLQQISLHTNCCVYFGLFVQCVILAGESLGQSVSLFLRRLLRNARLPTHCTWVPKVPSLCQYWVLPLPV